MPQGGYPIPPAELVVGPFGGELKKTTAMNWTVVCPSSFFDPEGPLTGNYEIGTEGHLLFNEAGESRVTYNDLACAMVDIAEAGSCRQMQITVLTRQVPS